jgi:hypothetical protein
LNILAVFSAFCVLPIISMERKENLEYDIESLNKDGELKEAMYSAEHFQKMIKSILLKLDGKGVLDF